MGIVVGMLEMVPPVSVAAAADGVQHLKTSNPSTNGATIRVPGTTTHGIWSHQICKGEKEVDVEMAALAVVVVEEDLMMEELLIGVVDSNPKDHKVLPLDHQVRSLPLRIVLIIVTTPF